MKKTTTIKLSAAAAVLIAAAIAVSLALSSGSEAPVAEPSVTSSSTPAPAVSSTPAPAETPSAQPTETTGDWAGDIAKITLASEFEPGTTTVTIDGQTLDCSQEQPPLEGAVAVGWSATFLTPADKAAQTNVQQLTCSWAGGALDDFFAEQG